MKVRRGSSGAGVFFPFSIGCMSQSSVAVADPQEKTKPQSDPSSSSSTTNTAQSSSEEGSGCEAASTPGIVTAGVQRLVKGIKSLFAGEEEDDEEMVIGYPTDVQHVGHIGWDDGLNKVGGAMGMVNAFSLPSPLSLRQLEVGRHGSGQACLT